MKLTDKQVARILAKAKKNKKINILTTPEMIHVIADWAISDPGAEYSSYQLNTLKDYVKEELAPVLNSKLYKLLK